MNDRQAKSAPDAHAEWWLGVADVATFGVAQTASGAERVHLAIADETFGILNRIPVVNAVSRVVQQTHHGIARLCYRGVRLSSLSLNRLVVRRG